MKDSKDIYGVILVILMLVFFASIPIIGYWYQTTDAYHDRLLLKFEKERTQMLESMARRSGGLLKVVKQKDFTAQELNDLYDKINDDNSDLDLIEPLD